MDFVVESVGFWRVVNRQILLKSLDEGWIVVFFLEKRGRARTDPGKLFGDETDGKLR